MASNSSNEPVISNQAIPLSQIFQRLGPLALTATATGDTSTNVRRVVSPEFAEQGDIVFITQRNFLDLAFRSSASVICIDQKLHDFAAPLIAAAGSSKTVFFSHEAERALRETVQCFFLQTPFVNRDQSELIHPTAIVHAEARLGKNVMVGPYAIIARGVTIGDDAVIGSHCVVEINAQIGVKTVLHPYVYIGHSCVLGQQCEIHCHTVIGKEGFGYVHDAKFNHYRVPHQGRVIIGDRVELGAGNTIDRGKLGDTEIRSGCIFDNRIHIAHNCVVGENSVITCGLVVAGSTKIGRNFVTGGNVSMTGHIEVCDNVQLAGVSVVRKSIEKPGPYGGNPLMPLRESTRMLAAMAKLPELLRHFKRSKEASDTNVSSASAE